MHGHSCKCLSLCLTCLPRTGVYELSARYDCGPQLTTSIPAQSNSLNLNLHAHFESQQRVPWTNCCMSVTGLHTCWRLHCWTRVSPQTFPSHVTHSLQSTAVLNSSISDNFCLRTCCAQSKLAVKLTMLLPGNNGITEKQLH